MKKHLVIVVAALICLASSCKKDDSKNPKSGASVSDDASAKAAFITLNNFWMSTLEPALTKQTQTYTNTAITGASGGSAIVNGSYSTTHFSSSTNTSSTSNVEALISFSQYKTSSLTIDGELYFFDYSSSRSACSDAGCASAYHTSLDYQSKDDKGTALPAVAMNFSYGGKNYSDKLTFIASKSDNETWSVKVTNSGGETFSFYY